MTADVRDTFRRAIDDALTVVTAIRPDQWELPGLGEWSVRDLCGHTFRAVFTAHWYYDQPAPVATLDGVGQYFRNALAMPDIHRSVAERGREAGAELGADPAAAVRAIIEDHWPTIAAADLTRVVEVAGGSMEYGEYLRSRLFEIVVHTDDLCRALGMDDPFDDEVLREVGRVVVEIGAGDALVRVLRASLGRGELAEGFTLLR